MKVLPHCGINLIGMTGEVLPLYLEDVRTITFAGNNSGIMDSASVSTGTYLGESWIAGQGDVIFSVTGSSVTLRLATIATYYIYVDGVLNTTTASDSAWHDYVISLGSDAAHTVVIAAKAFGVAIYRSGGSSFAIVTGVAPAISYPANFSNPLVSAFEAVSGAYIVDDGTATDSTYGRGSSGWLRFKATASRIKAFVASGESILLYQDGVFLSEGIYSGDGLGWIDLGATDSTTEHEYWLRQASPNGNYIMTISAASVNTTPLAAKDLWQYLGDSITYGFGLSSYRYAWANLNSVSKSVAHVNSGQSAHSLVADAASIGGWASNWNPKKVVINYGYNDIGGVIDDFRNAVYDALHALCGVASITKIYYPGIWNYSGDGANRATWNSAIQAICSGGPDAAARTLTAPEIAKITYLDTDGVLSSWADGIHPDTTGAQQIATFLIANTT